MAINLKDHIFAVCSHPNSEVSERLTKKCILKIKELGGEIILSSHCPASVDLLSYVDYHIYDKNNRLILANEYKNFDISNYVFYENEEYYSEFVKPIIYDYAVFKLIKNSVALAQSLNKNYLHVINYDCLLDIDDYIKNFIDPLASNDLCYTVWDKDIKDMIATYLFSFKIDSFINLFVSIKNEQDYFKNRYKGWQLEKLFWDYGENQKLKYYKGDYPNNKLNTQSINTVNIFENIFISTDLEKNIYLFIKNFPFGSVKFNVLTTNYNRFHTLEPKNYLFIKIGLFNPGGKIQIFYKGIQIYDFILPENHEELCKTNITKIKKISDNLLKKAYSIGISQNKNELIDFIAWIKNKNIKNILEIGTDKGGNFYLLSNLEKDGVKISIDLPSARFGEQINVDERNKILKQCPGKIHLINGNSQDPSIIKQVEFILKSEKLDLLFIDGDHTYTGVRQDYNNYVNFVKDGGAVVFHDIINSESHKNQNVGVNKFWNEIHGEKLEFKSDNTFWGGLGVLIKNENDTNIETITKEEVSVHFIQGAFCEILGDSDKKYDITFEDENGKLIHAETVNINCYAKCFQQFFTEYNIKILDNQTKDLLYLHKFDCQNKRVYIHIDSESLGDSIGWFPYVEEFRKKHNCELICSTFWNKLFESQYKNIEFVKPGSVVNDLYAMYEIGLFNDPNKEPENYQNIPLQKISSNILGLEYKEIKPKIYIKNNQSSYKEKNKTIAISTASTCQAKFWNRDGGWQKIIDYLIEKKYQVVLLQKEESNLKNIIKPNVIDIQETITWLTKSNLYIGLSSGVSWLAWALDIPVIMISGFTNPYNEFQCERISPQENVCQGCYHDHLWDHDARKNWNYCPKHENTNRQFECTKLIAPDVVIDKLKLFIK